MQDISSVFCKFRIAAIRRIRPACKRVGAGKFGRQAWCVIRSLQEVRHQVAQMRHQVRPLSCPLSSPLMWLTCPLSCGSHAAAPPRTGARARVVILGRGGRWLASGDGPGSHRSHAGSHQSLSFSHAVLMPLYRALSSDCYS
jgi:hypothetical protein